MKFNAHKNRFTFAILSERPCSNKIVKFNELYIQCNRVAEVARGHGGPPPKSLDSDENFKPDYTLFCRELRFDLRCFWRSLGKTSAFLGQKQCSLGKKCIITGYILHTLLKQICKFAIIRKNDAFVAKIVNTRLTKIVMATFAPDERLPSSATLRLIRSRIQAVGGDWGVFCFLFLFTQLLDRLTD